MPRSSYGPMIVGSTVGDLQIGSPNLAGLPLTAVLDIFPADEETVDFQRSQETTLSDLAAAYRQASVATSFELKQEYHKAAFDAGRFNGNNIDPGSMMVGTVAGRTILKIALRDEDVRLNAGGFMLADPVLHPIMIAGSPYTPVAVSRPNSAAKPNVYQLTFTQVNGDVRSLSNANHPVHWTSKLVSGSALTAAEAFEYAFDPADLLNIGFGGTLRSTVRKTNRALTDQIDYFTNTFQLPEGRRASGILRATYEIESTFTIEDPQDVDLVLQEPSTGTIIARHNLVIPNSSGTFDIPVADVGAKNVRIGIHVITWGASEVNLTLSPLRVYSEASRAAPRVREIVHPLLSELQGEVERKDSNLEEEIERSTQLWPPGTVAVARKTPQYGAAADGTSVQTLADSFDIPASGWVIGLIANLATFGPVRAVDMRSNPGDYFVWTDVSGGNFYVVSTGSKLRLRNTNIAENGPYPSASVRARQIQWVTIPETAAGAAAVQTLLSQAAVEGIADARALLRYTADEKAKLAGITYPVPFAGLAMDVLQQLDNRIRALLPQSFEGVQSGTIRSNGSYQTLASITIPNVPAGAKIRLMGTVHSLRHAGNRRAVGIRFARAAVAIRTRTLPFDYARDFDAHTTPIIMVYSDVAGGSNITYNLQANANNGDIDFTEASLMIVMEP